VDLFVYSAGPKPRHPFLVRTDLSFESYHPLFSLIGNGIWLLWSDRAGSDMADYVCLQRCQFRQRHFFNVRYRVILTHLVVPPALLHFFAKIDLRAGINQALKDDLSHFRRICDDAVPSKAGNPIQGIDRFLQSAISDRRLFGGCVGMRYAASSLENPGSVFGWLVFGGFWFCFFRNPSDILVLKISV
jgi:hypothetical protein